MFHEDMSCHELAWRRVVLTFLSCACILTRTAGPGQASTSFLSNERHGPRMDRVPARPRPLFEAGDPFLGTGALDRGFRIPGGAVWNPSLLVFGDYRTALQRFDDGRTRSTEWPHRLDLYANVQLTGTERILVGVRPLDQEGRFTSLILSPDAEEGLQNETNLDLRALFFEGELTGLFPHLDPEGRRHLDYGLSLGRQEVAMQDGLLLLDTVDAVGATRNNLLPRRLSNLQVTLFHAWNHINRGTNLDGNNVRDDQADMWSLSFLADHPKRTVEADVLRVDSPGPAGRSWHGGVGSVQKLGRFDTTLRLAGSFPEGGGSRVNGRGVIILGEASFTARETHDLMYGTFFAALDRFTSVARDPSAGGPLGRAGILFEARGLGRYDAALSNQASDALGAAVGWQTLLGGPRRQLVLEAGLRDGWNGSKERLTAAVGSRYQRTLSQHWFLQLDTFVATGPGRRGSHGLRVEMRAKF